MLGKNQLDISYMVEGVRACPLRSLFHFTDLPTVFPPIFYHKPLPLMITVKVVVPLSTYATSSSRSIEYLSLP